MTELPTFADFVRHLLERQRQYFKNRDSATLQECKAIEAFLSKWLETPPMDVLVRTLANQYTIERGRQPAEPTRTIKQEPAAGPPPGFHACAGGCGRSIAAEVELCFECKSKTEV